MSDPDAPKQDAEQPVKGCATLPPKLQEELVNVQKENSQLRVALFALLSGAVIATFATAWKNDDEIDSDRHPERNAVEIHQRLQIRKLKEGIERLLEERKMRMLEQGEGEESMIEKLPNTVPFRGRRQPPKA